MTHTIEPSGDTLSRLSAECAGFVHLPGEPAYDAGRAAWNVTISQRPAAVAVPETVEQLSRVVRAAARHGFRVTAQTTGHAASPLSVHPLGDVILIRTTELRGVHIDPVHRIARVEAGVQWQQLVDAAAVHGLVALHGSSPNIGVVGYTLGGGLGWYARKHGLASGSVTGVEIVQADGEVVRADARTRPDLFWAVRGGGGNFGVVTVIELALEPIAEAFAGMLIWDLNRLPEVLRTWAEWCRTAPEEITTAFRVMRFPPIPELPDFLRGRSVVILDGVALLDDDEAVEALAPLRALAPEIDTFGRVPAASLTRLHMDPENPTPSVGGGIVLSELDDGAVAAFLEAVGPDSETSVFMAELRHLGGALSRSKDGAGALASIRGSHVVLVLSMTPTPNAAEAGRAAVDEVLALLAPWASEQAFLNLAERPVDPRTAFEPATWDRLRAVRNEVDPGGLFLANYAIEA